MSRHRHFLATGSIIDLFPFLSILVCVIGVITFQIIALSLSASEADSDSSCGLQVCCGAEFYYIENGENGYWSAAEILDSALNQRLTEIGNGRWTHMVLLVTPEGFHCFNRLRLMATTLDVPLSYEPVDQCPAWASRRE